MTLHCASELIFHKDDMKLHLEAQFNVSRGPDEPGRQQAKLYISQYLETIIQQTKSKGITLNQSVSSYNQIIKIDQNM